MVLEGMLVGPKASVRNFLQTFYKPTKTYSSSPAQHVGLINDRFIHAIVLDTTILAFPNPLDNQSQACTK